MPVLEESSKIDSNFTSGAETPAPAQRGVIQYFDLRAGENSQSQSHDIRTLATERM
jgi:hypothetical protein